MSKRKIKKTLIFTALTLFLGVGIVYGFGKKAIKSQTEIRSANGLKPMKRASLWYQYNSGSPTDASSYSELTTQPANEEEASNLCPGDEEICVIRAPQGSDDHPAAFSSAFQTEINNAVTSGTETPNVKLKEN